MHQNLGGEDFKPDKLTDRRTFLAIKRLAPKASQLSPCLSCFSPLTHSPDGINVILTFSLATDGMRVSPHHVIPANRPNLPHSVKPQMPLALSRRLIRRVIARPSAVNST